RGRVGRCQVCKTQLMTINIFSTQKQAAKRPVKGRSQRGLLCYKAQRQKQSGVPTKVRPLQETNPKGFAPKWSCPSQDKQRYFAFGKNQTRYANLNRFALAR
ncbi:hypothetical protein ABUK73_14890, partial [Agrobacterium sp. BA1120]|uniref:hypothetical protein n=1 Tax=Agrobacterium sp. BA1120 TaxID=3228927 RepID=UPI003369F146